MLSGPDHDARPATVRRLSKAIEIEELRAALAVAQDQLVALAVDAGQSHAVIDALQVELASVRKERDAWRTEAGQHRPGAAA